MKILVTGGAGFIGNQLIVRLLDEGHEVVTVDSVNDYYDLSLKEARLNRIADRVEIVRADICDLDTLEDVFKKHSFDAVAHLAAQAGVRYSLEHPDVYVRSNYEGTFNILELAKKYNIKQVVAASTSSVYGESLDMPFKEDNSADRPMSIYAATKRATEILGASYCHLYDMNITFLRFFTVYGPWGRPDMALFIFTNKMLKGESITVFNNGEMKRDFTYIDDIVDGFIRALQKPLGYEVINLGHGSPVHLMEFINILEKVLGIAALIDFQPIQPGDVPETYADISKAKRLIGFEAKVPVAEGVPNFVRWYKEYYGL